MDYQRLRHLPINPIPLDEQGRKTRTPGKLFYIPYEIALVGIEEQIPRLVAVAGLNQRKNGFDLITGSLLTPCQLGIDLITRPEFFDLRDIQMYKTLIESVAFRFYGTQR